MRRLEAMFKALGDGTRLRIMSILLNQELCVCEIVETLKLPQSRISRHLGILRDAGMVMDRREAQNVYYRLNSGDKVVDKIASTLAELFSQESLQEDGDNLKIVVAGRVNNVCCPNGPDSAGSCGASPRPTK